VDERPARQRFGAGASDRGRNHSRGRHPQARGDVSGQGLHAWRFLERNRRLYTRRGVTPPRPRPAADARISAIIAPRMPGERVGQAWVTLVNSMLMSVAVADF